MKLGVLTNVVGNMPLEDALKYFKSMGIQMVEIGCGGYPGKAHCDPALLLEDEGALSAFKRVLKKNGLEAELLDMDEPETLAHAFAAMLPETAAAQRANAAMADFLKAHI